VLFLPRKDSHLKSTGVFVIAFREKNAVLVLLGCSAPKGPQWELLLLWYWTETRDRKTCVALELVPLRGEQNFKPRPQNGVLVPLSDFFSKFLRSTPVLLWGSPGHLSRDQQSCKFMGTKETVYIRNEFSFHRISLGHQRGGRFVVLGHQYGCRDVEGLGGFNCLTASWEVTHFINDNWSLRSAELTDSW